MAALLNGDRRPVQDAGGNSAGLRAERRGGFALPQDLHRIDVNLDPQRLRDEPELAAHIGIIVASWSEVENEIAFLFILATGVEPAIAAACFGRAVSLAVRLDMLSTALHLRVPEDVVAPFKRLRKRIEKRGKERNRIVHGNWTTHKRHPDSLIRTNGITDPHLRFQAYTRRDFLEIERRLVRLQIDLRLFAQSLVPSLRPEARAEAERFWRLTTPRRSRGRNRS